MKPTLENYWVYRNRAYLENQHIYEEATFIYKTEKIAL